MDINKYQLHKDFDRNEAIFVLHSVDHASFEEIAKNFNLSVEEVKKVIEMHGKYEDALIGSHSE